MNARSRLTSATGALRLPATTSVIGVRGTWLVLSIAALIVVVLGLAVAFFPWPSGKAPWPRERPGRARKHNRRIPASFPLLRGVGYLGVALRGRRRIGVQQRVGRAIARVDTVDPYFAMRRIGLALAEVGLVDPAPTAELPTDRAAPASIASSTAQPPSARLGADDAPPGTSPSDEISPDEAHPDHPERHP